MVDLVVDTEETIMQFKKATREAIKLKAAISGLTGSGKTMGSLLLARGLVGEKGRIAVIDTEQGKSQLYADHAVTGHIPFDVLVIDAPYTTQKYIKAIEAGIKEGYDLLIIDSISHEWDGEGGIKEQKDAIDARGGNQFTNWGKVTPMHNQFISTILNAPCHILCTMRSKSDVVLELNDKGRQAPKKVGLKAIQREGVEFEFDLIFDMAHNQTFSVTKDRTGLFNGRIEMLSEKIGVELRNWISSGKVVSPIAALKEANTNPNPTPLISQEQEAVINDLLEQSGADKNAFCAHFKVSGLYQLTTEQYPQVVDQLQKKLAKRKMMASGG